MLPAPLTRSRRRELSGRDPAFRSSRICVAGGSNGIARALWPGRPAPGRSLQTSLSSAHSGLAGARHPCLACSTRPLQAFPATSSAHSARRLRRIAERFAPRREASGRCTPGVRVEPAARKAAAGVTRSDEHRDVRGACVRRAPARGSSRSRDDPHTTQRHAATSSAGTDPSACRRRPRQRRRPSRRASDAGGWSARCPRRRNPSRWQAPPRR